MEATETLETDVLVVGAGPGGSATAYHLARHGVDVILVDKATFPREKVCGDGLTPRGVRAIQRMGVDPAEPGFVRIDALRTYGADGSTFDPKTGDVDPDGPGPAPAFNIGTPDFNFKSLRGNLVLRWEFRPGSTAYAVWTQSRSDQEDGLGEFAFHRSVPAFASRQWIRSFPLKGTPCPGRTVSKSSDFSLSSVAIHSSGYESPM